MVTLFPRSLVVVGILAFLLCFGDASPIAIADRRWLIGTSAAEVDTEPLYTHVYCVSSRCRDLTGIPKEPTVVGAKPSRVS